MSFQGSTEWMQGWRSSDCCRQTVPRPGSSDKKRSVTQWRPLWYLSANAQFVAAERCQQTVSPFVH